MAKPLFIDDERDPPRDGQAWAVVRSSQEAIDWCQTHGAPSLIAFDHDLGGEDTAMRVVHWLIERDLDAKGQWLPVEFAFQVHSQNPQGARNITATLGRYLAFRAEEGWVTAPSSDRRPRW